MGFIKWIKRETDSPNKRRQSEPPITMASSLASEYPRDEAYLKALSKFNEWRNKKKLGSLGKSCRKIYKKNKRTPLDESTLQKGSDCGVGSISNSEYVNTTNNKENDESTELKNIYEEIEYADIRKSLNTNKSVSHSKTLNEKLDPLIASYENEIENFERNHCSHIDLKNIKDTSSLDISSPPTKFYKKNSIPFRHIKSSKCNSEKSSILYSSPKKIPADSKFEKQKTRKQRSRTTICTVESYQYRYDQSNKNSYKNVATSANISLSSDCVNSHSRNHSTARNAQQRNIQAVMNKHGDVVEYVEPLYPEIVATDLDVHHENDGKIKQNEFQNYVEENFKFLENTSINSAVPKLVEEEDESSMNINDRFRKNVIVTDLDQSDQTPKQSKESQINDDDIINELEALELWSQSLNLIPIDTSSTSKKQLNLSGTYSCCLKDLKSTVSSLRNSFKCPITYRSGVFRTTAVSLFSFDHSEKDKAKAALRKNYLILRKLRHPNVSLLMAICVDKMNEIVSLVMEPFENTLNDILHKYRIVLQMENCIDFVLQIINAVKYMHECKLIHSNISSHAVLIDVSKKLVKLSAFELTTNFEDYQNVEQKFKMYQNDSNFNESKLSKDDLPYFMEYRKLYSQYCYQAPELITTKHQFVLPTMKSDIYGVTLLLWEMIHNRIPYESITYVDLEKLLQLNQIKLPCSETENYKLLNTLLEQGLCSQPEKRLDNFNKFIAYLEEISKETNNSPVSIISKVDNEKQQSRNLESDSLLDFSKILKSKNFGSELYERTSTVKKRKENIKCNNQNTVRSLFQNKNDVNYRDKKMNKSADDIIMINEDDNLNVIETNEHKENLSKNYDDSGITSNGIINTAFRTPPEEFQSIEQKNQSFNETSNLLDTPIARKNKILKTVWLSNNSSPGSPNTKVMKHNISSGGKTINVNIRITHDVDGEEQSPLSGGQKHFLTTTTCKEDSLEQNKVDIVNQIKYWNSLTSADTTVNSDYQKSDKKLKHQSSNYLKTTPRQGNCSRNIYEKSGTSASISTNLQCEHFEEFFCKSRLNDDDFEKMLWRREKEKCEQKSMNTSRSTNDDDSRGVITPRRISVRETVSKFENYLSRTQQLCILPKILNFHENNNEVEEVKGTDSLQENEKTDIIEKSSDDVNALCTVPSQTETQLVYKDVDKGDNSGNPSINISKLDVILQNKNHNKTVDPSEDINKETEYDVLAKTRSITDLEMLASKICENYQQPILLSLKLKKLCRRASDIGYRTKTFTTTKRSSSSSSSTTTTATAIKCQSRNNIRHSICGTEEIFRRLGEVPFLSLRHRSDRKIYEAFLKSHCTLMEKARSADENVAKSAEKQENIDTDGISIQQQKISKVKCWNCGCQVFTVNEIQKASSSSNCQEIDKNDSKTATAEKAGNDDDDYAIATSALELSIRRSLSAVSQNTKSVEDLYIDDDFDKNGLGELCANIELGIENDDNIDELSKIFDFDILSAEILNK